MRFDEGLIVLGTVSQFLTLRLTFALQLLPIMSPGDGDASYLQARANMPLHTRTMVASTLNTLARSNCIHRSSCWLLSSLRSHLQHRGGEQLLPAHTLHFNLGSCLPNECCACVSHHHRLSLLACVDCRVQVCFWENTGRVGG